MTEGGYALRLAQKADRDAIVSFMNTHWDIRHPIINLPDFFDYYYNGEGDALNFALASRGGALAAIAGYIPASRAPQPDIWVSIWVADKAASGAGLELMAALPQLTGCRTLACNNIRPATRPFYEFLGYTTGRVQHYYRLAARGQYRVARVGQPRRPQVCGDVQLQAYISADALAKSGFVPPEAANPKKDLWYISRRYFAYPRQQYLVYGAVPLGRSAPEALLVMRRVSLMGTHVLRIVDYIGDEALLPRMGKAIDSLLEHHDAEYVDFYCVGISEAALCGAGFLPRSEDSGDIIPNYLSPPLFENTEYYYFTSDPAGFRLCRADGDQDRPNIPADEI